jgi:hypothetical protein
MKEVKLKKEIQKGSFVIVGNEVVEFNKKYKIAEMKSGDEGIITFESKEDGDKFLSGDSEKEFQKELSVEEFQKASGIKISTEQRKRDKSGKYNHPIILRIAKPNVTEAVAFAEDFQKEVKLGKTVETVKKEVIIKVYDKSKGSVLNKLLKYSNRGRFNFVNSGNLVTIL